MQRKLRKKIMRKKKNEPAGVTVSPTNNTILFGFIQNKTCLQDNNVTLLSELSTVSALTVDPIGEDTE